MAFHFQSTDSDGYEEEELAQFEAEWLHQHHSLHEMDPYTTTETESIDQVSSEPHEEYLETETSETYISSFDETGNLTETIFFRTKPIQIGLLDSFIS